MKSRHQVSSTLEDYLEAILVLVERQGEARVRDIAEMVSVHKSTVTAALKALTQKGLIHYTPYAAATLTEEGRRIAQGITHDHQVLRSFLEEILLVNPEAAETNACRMEHVVERDVLDRLVVFARYMKEARDAGRSCHGDYSQNVERELRVLRSKRR